MEFTKVSPQYPVDGGFADLVVFAKEDGIEKPIFVIETKRKTKEGVQYRFDPYSPKVIDQAAFYAMKIGAEYFATTNGEMFVSFKTFKTGVPLPERRVKPYKIQMRITNEVVKSILEDLTKLHFEVERWLPLDEVFVNRLQYFHSFIQPHVKRSLDYKLLDLDFKKRYEDWVKSQFFEVGENTNEQMASQAAYLLMNRILFYKTLETQRTDLPRLHKIDYTSGGQFTVELREYFKKALAIDYQAIFEERILNEIPVSNVLADVLNEFIEELDAYNLSKIRSDILGRVYEDLIPEDERHRLGQYYTPHLLSNSTEMCVQSPNDNVLDSGCGSGSFLVKAYYKLKELKKEENPLASDEQLHKEILNQLYGIDINQFPASLSSINLATRNLKAKSDVIDIVVSDFFKTSPSMFPFPKGGFDAVITNPPYTRQEEMEYKEQIRDAALTYTNGTKTGIGAQAGIYAYFFTHGAKFLMSGGRMGFITSNTWLDVGFGEGLKRFFLDHFKILAIIEHDAGVFEKANVDTCIVVLEKAEGKSHQNDRDSNSVKFIRMKKAIEIEKLVPLVSSTNTDCETETTRVHLKKQGELASEEKWGKYLRAPTVFYRIVAHPKMTLLKEVVRIKRGFTTGANEFFYLDREKASLWGIEKAYLGPIITSPRQAESCVVEKKDIDEYVLLVHEPEEALNNTNVLKYIRHGESISFEIRRGRQKGQTICGYHNVPMIKSRKLWYDLGVRDIAPLLFPCKIRKRCFFAWNRAHTYVDKSFYEIYPKKEKTSLVLAGLLNSTLTMLLIELHGRLYGRGLLELEVYELKNLPVIDVHKLEDKEKEKIKSSFLKICEAQLAKDINSEQEARMELDNAVFDVLGLKDNERKQVYEGLAMLRGMRLQRKEVKVLVETAEKWEPLIKQKKRGAKSGEGLSKRLETWMK